MIHSSYSTELYFTARPEISTFFKGYVDKEELKYCLKNNIIKIKYRDGNFDQHITVKYLLGSLSVQKFLDEEFPQWKL